jgi:hypothetical protein
VTIIPERIEHPFNGPVRLLFGVYVFLVNVVVSDGVERLGIQRHALAILFIERSRALRAPDHVGPERGSNQHNEQDEYPHHRVPQVTSGLRSFPHAAIVS